MEYAKYPLVFKSAMIQKFLSDDNIGIGQFSRDIGIPESSLRDWIRASEAGKLYSMDKQKHHTRWDSAKKFSTIMEYEKVPDEDKGKWLRTNGLKYEHIEVWKKELTSELSKPKTKNKDKKEDKKKIVALEKEIRRKDKALAEVTALLTLKKKADILFGKVDEEE